MEVSREIFEKTLATSYGERAYRLVEILTDAGHEAWWVGGAVRDLLQNAIPLDIDIATSAHPKEVLELFKRSYDPSMQLGSVRVPIGTDIFEVTTFRKEDEASDGRHPESITFSTREEDARRRDFTMNAIYFHPISRELYDPFAGLQDLKERLVRFIGEPAERLQHDALRILRAIRLRATIDGQYHPETYAALRELGQMIELLSGSRQLEELEKMLACAHPARALEDLWELQILQRFLPELAACKGIAQPADYHREGDVWDHLLLCTESFSPEDQADIRLAALFHDVGKTQTFSIKERIRFDHHAPISARICRTCLSRLQCSARRIEKIAWLIEHHMMMSSFFEMNDERKSHWYYHPWFPELLRLFYLDIAGTKPADFSLYERILSDYQHYLDKRPRPVKSLLSGEEIMRILGLPSGEAIGRMLKKLHDAQIAGDVSTKDEARAFVKKQTSN